MQCNYGETFFYILFVNDIIVLIKIPLVEIRVEVFAQLGADKTVRRLNTLVKLTHQ